MRLFGFCLIFALGVGLAACASGSPSGGFIDPDLARSYIGLPNPARATAGGAAIVVAPNIAATNAHNANLVAPADVLAVSDRYDLLFFRTGRTDPVKPAEPRIGLQVVAYGQGNDDELREAHGAIELLAPTPDDCPTCPPETGFAYRAPGGPGFSGGPVTEAERGTVLGLTFGYIDSPIESGKPRLMLAYTVAQVRAEMARLLPR